MNNVDKWINKYSDSTRDEMRAIRRDKINHCLWLNGVIRKKARLTLNDIKQIVRYEERADFEMELKYYE